MRRSDYPRGVISVCDNHFLPTRDNSKIMKYRFSTFAAAVFVGALLIATNMLPNSAEAEYGDVVLNEYSEDAGMRPVVFPHWFHRIRFRCKVCHGDLGFAFEAGGNNIDMLKIIDGQYCGACHDGDVAWSIENCELCHSGMPDTPTQVHHSTVQQLVKKAREDEADAATEEAE